MATNTAVNHTEEIELPFAEAWGEFESPEQEADYWSDFSVLEDISQDW